MTILAGRRCAVAGDARAAAAASWRAGREGGYTDVAEMAQPPRA